MTLGEVQRLLNEREIKYYLRKYETEKDFLEHIYLFPETEGAEECHVCSIVIPCQNEFKDMEIQFNKIDGVYTFVEILFGEFCFEMYDHPDEYFAEDLMHIIFQVISGQIVVIVRNDIDKKRWVGDACFYLSDDDPVVGEPAFFRELERLQLPKTFLEEKLTTKKQYEIYSYNSYQCIVR